MNNYYIQKIMNSFINGNLFIDNGILNLIERNNSEIPFLNKKRNFEQSIFYNGFNNINPHKEVDFTLHRKIEEKNEAYEFVEAEEPNNLKGPSDQSVFNNYKISDFEKQKLIEIEKLIKKLITINLESENQNTKDNNILKGDKGISIIINKKIDESDNINDVNSNQSNLLSNSKNLNKLNKVTLKGRGKRWSKYRGVSKNGNQWQVLIMLHKRKSYIGTYSTEEMAARIYDILSIRNRGVKAKTNFLYNEKQIKKIRSNKIDIRAKNINEIISNLLKED